MLLNFQLNNYYISVLSNLKLIKLKSNSVALNYSEFSYLNNFTCFNRVDFKRDFKLFCNTRAHYIGTLCHTFNCNCGWAKEYCMLYQDSYKGLQNIKIPLYIIFWIQTHLV